VQSLTLTDTTTGIAGSASVDVHPADTTAPTIAITTPVDGVHYGAGQSVMASYTCSDAGGSGVKSCDGSVPNFSLIDTGTLGQHTFTVNAVDNAGNAASATVHYTVDDRTNPIVTLVSPVDGRFYPANPSFKAAYTCVDDGGGSGIATCLGTTADGAPFDTSTEGPHTFTVTATDVAGNTTTKTATYRVDGTGPAIVATAPTEGATYFAGSVPFASYSCTDTGGSGVATCSGSLANGVRLDNAPGDHTFVVGASDNVDNESSVTIHYHVVPDDHTAPTITITRPADGAFYKRNTPVSASYSCSDGAAGSGVSACSGASSVDTASEGQHSYTVNAADNAGNAGSKTVAYNVDGTGPAISITTPAEGATYSAGSVPNASYACTDAGGSGVATCAGPIASGVTIDATPGDYSFVVNASDNVGNASSRTIHYQVAPETVVVATPPSGGGGGGGGGSSGIPPDLHVDVSASASGAPPAVGSELDYYITVSSRNVGGSSAVRLDLALPAGYTLTKTYADRGAGCSGGVPALTCDVAWINQSTSTHVTVSGTVAQAGELDLTATVTSLLEPELDGKDNSLTFKLVPQVFKPPATPPTAPSAKAAPTLAGTPVPGRTLRAASAKWSSAPTMVAYQWQLCTSTRCTAIGGATGALLRVVKAYVGRSVRVVETATIDGQTVKSTSRRMAIRKR